MDGLAVMDVYHAIITQ